MATITIVTNASQSQRAAKAFGEKLNLGRDATGDEIRAWIIEELRTIIQHYERRILQKANDDALPAATQFDPT